MVIDPLSSSSHSIKLFSRINKSQHRYVCLSHPLTTILEADQIPPNLILHITNNDCLLLTSEADSPPAPSPFYIGSQAEAAEAKLEAAEAGDRGRVVRDTAGEAGLYSDYYKQWILNHLG